MPTDSNGSSTQSNNRRTYLKYIGVGAITALAGCLGGGSNQSNDGGSNQSNDGGSNQSNDGGSSSAKEFVIGSNHPLTGSLAFTGNSMQMAIEMAAKHKNDNGGIKSLGGAKVKVLKGDNQGKQSLAGQVEQQLIKKGANVMVGCFNSDATMAATAVAERSQVPHVIDVAAASKILKGRGLNYVYRLQPTTYNYAHDWAKFYPEILRKNGFKIKTVGHYYIDNAYGSEINKFLKNQFASKNDLKIVESTPVTDDQSDANAQVAKLKKADPDCICLTGYEQDADLFFRSLKNVGYRPKWVSASANVGLVSKDQSKKMGKQTLGIMDANYALNPNVQITKNFSKKFKKYSGRTAAPEAAFSWAVMQVIFKAVERAGTTDKKQINKAIANTSLGSKDIPLAMPGVDFQDNGENKHALAAMNQIRDNYEIKVVYPSKYAAISPKVKPGET